MKRLFASLIITTSIISCTLERSGCGYKAEKKSIDAAITSTYAPINNYATASLFLGQTVSKFGDTIICKGAKGFGPANIRSFFIGGGYDKVFNDYRYDIVPKLDMMLVYTVDKSDRWSVYANNSFYYDKSYKNVSFMPSAGVKYWNVGAELGYRFSNRPQSLTYMNAFNLRLRFMFAPVLQKVMMR